MYKYAQINDDGICFAMSQLSGEVDSPDMIRILDSKSYLGMKYEDGVWSESEVNDAGE